MERKTVVVNMFAGPGAGKTTAAWEIASELKKRGYVTEYVPEYAKELVWDKNFELLDGSPEHQAQLLEVQTHRLERLNGQVDFIVTDSPILLNPQYLKASSRVKEAYEREVYLTFSKFTNFCVLIQRGQDFEQSGRIHNLEESKRLDQEIKATLDRRKIYYGTYTHQTVPKIADNCITTYNRVNRENQKEASRPMTLEEKRTTLFKKIVDEQNVFRNWLKSLSPQEIINHAYQYATREDIAVSFEDNLDSLEEHQVDALLAMPDTMDDICKEYTKRPSYYMEDISDTIKTRAEEKASELYPTDPDVSVPAPTLPEMKEEVQKFVKEHWEEDSGQTVFRKMKDIDGNDYGKVSALYDEVQALKRQFPSKSVSEQSKKPVDQGGMER